MAPNEFERTIEEAREALVAGRVEEMRRSLEPAVEMVELSHGTEETAELSTRDRLKVASLLQAAFRFGGDRTDFDRGLAICRPLADRVTEPSAAVLARATMATFYVLSGELHAMVGACDAAIELAHATGLGEDPAAAMAHQFRGYALYEWDRIPEAADALEEAWRLAPADAGGIRSGTARMMAMVQWARDDEAGAALWTQRLLEIVSEPMTLRNREWLDAVRALQRGGASPNVRTADSWAHRYGYPTHGDARPDQSEAASRLHEYDHLLTVLESTSQWPAMLHVSDAMALGAGSARGWYAVRAKVARAVGLEGLHRREEADRVWAEALQGGRSEGYVRVYLYGAWPRRKLLERASGAPELSAMVEALRAVSRPIDGTETSLTPRQLETLRHVARGLSNRDVAQAMSVSEATVKTHLRGVYERLGVRSRTQAVATARRLGVL